MEVKLCDGDSEKKNNKLETAYLLHETLPKNETIYCSWVPSSEVKKKFHFNSSHYFPIFCIGRYEGGKYVTYSYSTVRCEFLVKCTIVSVSVNDNVS